MNNARAMRVAEIMNDFRALQYHISRLQATPRQDEYYLEGYAWLRHSITEAQSVLAQQYAHDTQHPQGNAEVEKRMLKLYVLPKAVCWPYPDQKIQRSSRLSGRKPSTNAVVLCSLANWNRIIIDASIRRFQCQRAYMRAVLCWRWIDGRTAILQNRSANPADAAQAAQLLALDGQLRSVSTFLLRAVIVLFLLFSFQTPCVLCPLHRTRADLWENCVLLENVTRNP